ncbi:MAG: hypothetical protein IT341_10475 [Chloroflexi bacterium]|nr:hypothetical protein [Chloroflexota bacterium]
MTRAATPDRRRAFLVRTRPLPVFRVRSASGEPAHLVVVQRDLSMTCQCTAASFGARDCSHRRKARRSIEWRTGYRLPEGRAPTDAAGILAVLQGGRRSGVDAAWDAA